MRKLILGILFSCYAFTVIAAPVKGLYQASVPVASQDQNLQKEALQQALSQVFIKISGNSGVIKAASIQKAVSMPSNYLLSYGYSDGVLPTGSQSLMLDASFDPKLTKTVLRNAGQSIWGENRPLVLLWVLVQQTNSPAKLVSANTQDIMEQQFTHVAQQRALPIVFPILDLTDLQAISTNDILSNKIATIEHASKRYASDAILTVDLQQSDSQTWNGKWMLLAQGVSTTWQTNGMSLDQAINAGMNAITDNLAAKFATSTTNAVDSEVQLTVVNIKDLNDYATVTRYLKGLVLVKQAEISQVQPSTLIYTLTVTGGETALQQSLSLDHHLQAVTGGDTAPGTGLVYQWIP